jgi:putative transposase
VKESQLIETQIIVILKETDAGMMVKEIYRKQGISDAPITIGNLNLVA